MPVVREKIRDRAAGAGEARIRFSSTILPKWARRSRSLDALLPVLYLRGVSTGDFQEALSALLAATNMRQLGFDTRTIADMLGQETEGMAAHYAREADLEPKLRAVVRKIETAAFLRWMRETSLLSTRCFSFAFER